MARANLDLSRAAERWFEAYLNAIAGVIGMAIRRLPRLIQQPRRAGTKRGGLPAAPRIVAQRPADAATSR